MKRCAIHHMNDSKLQYFFGERKYFISRTVDTVYIQVKPILNSCSSCVYNIHITTVSNLWISYDENIISDGKHKQVSGGYNSSCASK